MTLGAFIKSTDRSGDVTKSLGWGRGKHCASCADNGNIYREPKSLYWLKLS